MRTDWLQPLLGQTPPFATVYIDITGVGETAARETANRWRGLRRDLERDGAAAKVLDQLEEAVTGTPTRSGADGRLLIASESGIHIDRELVVAPSPSRAIFDQDPVMLPDALCADDTVDHLLVTVDRMGAELTRTGTDLSLPPAKTTVEGDQDEITRTQVTATMQGRVDHRTQDSWERNAAVVAAELDRVVQTSAPEVILVTGDVRAVNLVVDAAGPKTRELIMEVAGGSRNSGVNEQAFASHVATALESFRSTRRQRSLDAFSQAAGQGTGAVSSLADLVQVLRRGQVSEVLIVESAVTNEAMSGRHIWVGPEPLQLALAQSELTDLGITEGSREMLALIAVIRAAIAQNAEVTFIPDDEVELVDQVGALLRWDDEETPRDIAPSLSTDKGRLKTVT